MNNADLFKIKSNDVIPSRGKILISEPFLRDATFGRSVVLLIDHTHEGSMGLVLNKKIPLLLNDVINDFHYLEDIPIYKGGPIGTDTLFFLHTLPFIPGAISVSKGLYMNGDFQAVKKYILETKTVNGVFKFFLGYSGWDMEQLANEIKENTWLVGKAATPSLMTDEVEGMWKGCLRNLGSKYATWSRFPQIPTLN